MSSIVNGYYCRDCTDVELAKKGVNPADPRGERTLARGAVPSSTDRKPPLGLNEPESTGHLGTRINLRA